VTRTSTTPNSDDLNRDLVALKACLSKAVQWKLISVHPIRDVKRSKEDNRGTVRFLSQEEETRLREALTARDEANRAARVRGNEWRRERGHELMPDYGSFTDHLAPLVLLALNTGLRRGELFGLTWDDISFATDNLTVGGEGAKSGRTRHVPLNSEARATLEKWGAKAGGLVFAGPDGSKMVTLKTPGSTWRRPPSW